MPARHVIVDGSNIATEGRTTPSLGQLREAVAAVRQELPDSQVTVVVDATFGHRIDAKELREFEIAEAANEIVSPPAGAIGRGDAFLLRIAEKIGAVVLSNDSFQEFHGEHDWLFEEGRLMGGKPVPGVGWIFTPRSPVRGARSRKAVTQAKGTKAKATGADAGAAVGRAIAQATAESITGEEGPAPRRRRRRRGQRPAEAVNNSLQFIKFIADHKLGTEVEGEVESFTSHGAFVRAGGARCYVPIVALGDPPPRSVRRVLRKGERRAFVIQALDPQRRGIELALPEFARVSGAPQAETIEAEITEVAPPTKAAVKPAKPAKAAAKPAKKVTAKAAAKPAKKVAARKVAAKKMAAKPAKAVAKGSTTKARK